MIKETQVHGLMGTDAKQTDTMGEEREDGNNKGVMYSESVIKARGFLLMLGLNTLDKKRRDAFKWLSILEERVHGSSKIGALMTRCI